MVKSQDPRNEINMRRADSLHTINKSRRSCELSSCCCLQDICTPKPDVGASESRSSIAPPPGNLSQPKPESPGKSGSILDLRPESCTSIGRKALEFLEEDLEGEDTLTALAERFASDQRPNDGDLRGLPEPAKEAWFTNRYPPSFGAKASGPLSDMMAMTVAVQGKPDYDMLFRTPRSNAPCMTLGKQTAPNKNDDNATQLTFADQVVHTWDTSQVKTPSVGIQSPPRWCHTSTANVPSSAGPAADMPACPKKTVVYGPGGRKITLQASCRSQVAAAISSQLLIPEEEQHLLQESSSQPNVDFFRVEHKMDPRKVRYTQETISPNFRDGRPIYDLLNDLNMEEIDPLRELESLDVVWHNGFWRSLSNRRLWALKHCKSAFTGEPLFVRVRIRQPDAEFRSKCNSTNDGVEVVIKQRARSPSPSAAKIAGAAGA